MNQDISKKLKPSWPPLSGMLIYSLGTSVRQPGDTFGPRKQFSWEFIWINEGTVRAVIGRKRVSGGEGALFLVPPGVIDRYDFEGKRRHVHSFIHFTFTPPKPPWPAANQWPLKKILRMDDLLLELFRMLLATNYEKGPKASLLLAPTLDLMVRLFILDAPPRRSLYDPGQPPVVERALAWMRRLVETEPAARPTLGDLARHCYISPQHLNRQFKRHLELGPMKCLWLLRAQKAGSLLERTALSLKEVSAQAGFENGFHFSRVFKKLYGITPSNYREGFHKGLEFRPDLPFFRKHPFSRVLLNSDIGPPTLPIRRMRRKG